MANLMKMKRSSVPGKVPLATDLEPGELAVNLVDQKLYTKKTDGTVILVGSGDASVTALSITSALGYTPADAATVAGIETLLEAL